MSIDDRSRQLVQYYCCGAVVRHRAKKFEFKSDGPALSAVEALSQRVRKITNSANWSSATRKDFVIRYKFRVKT